MLEQKIKEYFPQASCAVFSEVESTNNIARDMAREGVREFTCVLAERQTGGRGRLGRSFFSPEGGIYLSVVLRPQISPADSLFITVAAAVAAAQAIEEVSSKECEIKWVNDIYIDGKKVCGILTEGAVQQNGGLDFAVLGIGINLFCDFPQELQNIAGCIFEKAANEDLKARIIGLFLQKFSQSYKNFTKKEFLAEYRARNFLEGKTVRYQKDGATHSGIVRGIDDNAALVVEQNGKVTALTYGEVQIERI